MKPRPHAFLLALLLVPAIPSLLLAAWPEFRGPTQDGHVPVGEAVPTNWSETENIRWKAPIHGMGWGTPVILDGKVWVTTASENGRTMSVICLDEKTGEVLLDRLVITNDNPEPLANKVNTYASPSPAVDAERVYLHWGSYGTVCLDTKTFEELWRRTDLTASHWRGPGSSVALWKDTIILTFDGTDQQYHVALDKKTGETLWRRDRSTHYDDIEANDRPVNSGDLRKAFSTPLFIEVDGQPQMISSGAKACWAYNPDTGEEIWSVHYPTHSPSSRPVYSPELSYVFINTGLGKPQLWAVRLDGDARGEIGETNVVWELLKRAPPRSSPVLANGLLFLAADSVGSCVDAKTGEVLWSERVGGTVSASLLYAGGNVYFFDEDGYATVVKASDTYEVVAENQLDEGLLASPAASNGALFIRTKTQLYCIGK